MAMKYIILAYFFSEASKKSENVSLFYIASRLTLPIFAKLNFDHIDEKYYFPSDLGSSGGTAGKNREGRNYLRRVQQIQA